MHARSEWQAQHNQTTSAPPQVDSQAAVSPVQPWQQTMAVVTQPTHAHHPAYIPSYQHYPQRSNPAALNYFDLSAQQFNTEQANVSPSTSLAYQFASLASTNQSSQYAQPNQTHQYAAVASLGYSDDDVVDEDADADPDPDAEGEEVEADGSRSDAQMSTAERVAQKRRMKRFRLTHEQTRFLINEFIRQPHPDAAHRERLSNEIPGLSPRQVQVWFQNRRAKMKRLPPEDRARVLDSRMLPEHFDATSVPQSSSGQTGLQSTGGWMTNPNTRIRSMDHLHQIVMEGVDAIYKRDETQQDVSGIESIISTNAYPSPMASGRSHSVSTMSTQQDQRWQASQRALSRSNTDGQLAVHNSVNYLGSEMYPTAPRPRARPESTTVYGRRPSLPLHHLETHTTNADRSSANEEHHSDANFERQ